MLTLRSFIAEFIGTFALIFVGVLVIFHIGRNEDALTGIALAHGLTIAVMASATAAISGGHLNPAVSFGMALVKKIRIDTMIGYWVAQLGGGVVAAYAVMQILPGDARAIISDGTPGPVNLGLMGALMAEAIATFFLMFVIFGTAVDRRAPKMGALFVGLAVTVGIFAVGPATGAAMNPARWFGPAFAVGKFGNVIIYFAGPMIGAALAALLYTFVLEDRPTLAPTNPARVDAQ